MIDIDADDGTESLTYVLPRDGLESAKDLATQDDAVSVVRELRSGAPIRVNSDRGHALDDDGTLEAGVAILERIRPWLGREVYRYDGRSQSVVFDATEVAG